MNKAILIYSFGFYAIHGSVPLLCQITMARSHSERSFYWETNTKGNWLCVDWNTGEVLYDTEWQTKGSLIYADEHLYCDEEQDGSLALVKANPEKFEIVSSFQITRGED